MTLIVRGAAPGIVRGSVHISGSKNGFLPLLMASMAIDGITRFVNVPTTLVDVQSAVALLRKFGAKIAVRQSALTIDARGATTNTTLAGSANIRYSMLLLGAGLGRHGTAVAPAPGGCVLGSSRPVDIHSDVLSELGAAVSMIPGGFCANRRRSRSSVVRLGFPSVGATENALLYAAQQRRTVVLRNAALEPEVLDLAAFLIAAGADITCEPSTRTLVVRGRPSLQPLNGVWRVSSDRIEAASYALLASAHRADVTMVGLDYAAFNDLRLLLRAIDCACEYSQTEHTVMVEGSVQGRAGMTIVAEPYPGIPTDVLPILCAVAQTRRGCSSLTDGVFNERLSHVAELRKLGMNIRVLRGRVKVKPSRVAQTGYARASCADIRTGFGLLVAASLRRGVTVLDGEEQIQRGYERTDEKLRSLGIYVRQSNK